MRPRDHLGLLAEYGRWMNERIFDVASKVPDEDRRRDLGAFFGSLHRTLDHLVWADRAWAIRWMGESGEIGPVGVTLFEDFEAMRTERRRLDARFVTWAANVDETTLDAPYTMHSVAYGRTRTLPLWMFAVHVFNHQTHHRGQATTLLSQLGYDPGITDLPWMPSLDGHDGALLAPRPRAR